jgi:magnesium chelatase family protein
LRIRRLARRIVLARRVDWSRRMIATLPSAALFGVDAYRVDIEVDVAGGLPQYTVVGLAATTVKEGGSRIRSALRACGQDMPPRRVTVNLAPADRRKDGAAFDLPIALGVLGAAGGFDLEPLRGLLIMGELGLDGTLRPVRGVLAAAALAREQGLRGLLVPAACAGEASVVEGLEVFAAEHLADVLRALLGELPMPRARPTLLAGERPAPGGDCDFSEVRGQELARKAVEIAAAGGHNLLLYGPPGLGKTMLARRVPGILPPMTRDEAIEVTRIYSAVGLAPAGLLTRRPFRAPHHTASCAALVGGGNLPRPGEISLAHRGVLFLDELPEFQRGAIESLRQPLEERTVRIARAQGTAALPASFLLVASANPCPCGWHGSGERACTCTPGMVERYRGRLSGPLLDRIDLQVRVNMVSLAQMREQTPGETSAVIRARVLAARERQAQRLAVRGVLTNAEMDAAATRATCHLTPAAERQVATLFAGKAGMTARALDRVLRVARTVADLAGSGRIDAEHVVDAGMYRAFDDDPTFDPSRLCMPRAVPRRTLPDTAGSAVPAAMAPVVATPSEGADTPALALAQPAEAR